MKDISDRLVSTVKIYTEKLLQLSDEEVSRKENPNQWSKKEYLGHLIDSATNNHQRFIRGQLYDQSVFPSYDQPLWVETHRYQTIDWKELVNLWKSLNFFLSGIINNVEPIKLDNTMAVGQTKDLTLQFVIEDYLDHLINHLEDVFG